MIEKILVTFLITAYPIYLIIKWCLIFFTFGKDIKPVKSKFKGVLREPPSNHKPYIVDTITSKYLVPSDKSLTATVLWFIKHRFISISHIDKKGVYGSIKREYYLKLNEKKAKDISKLTKSEQRFLGYLFQGSGDIATFSEIKSYGIRKASITHKFFKYWKDDVVFEMVRKGLIDTDSYFSKDSIKREMYIVFTVMLISLLAGLENYIKYALIFSVLMLIVMIVLHFLKSYMYKRTEEGNILYSQWVDFKNCLKDFRVTKNYSIDSLVLWEEYLIYGVALGVSKKALSQLPMDYNINKISDSTLGEISLLEGSIEGNYSLGSFLSDLIELTATLSGAYKNIEIEEKKIEKLNRSL